jgi:D-alanyl-D-alanine carboxypeptidase/D-alanyl-D-alanine-endopeptidase (penicillin-binding protein 4)
VWPRGPPWRRPRGLPPEVERLDARHGAARGGGPVCREWRGAPRLAGSARQPVNPASLMKLLTTYGRARLLGPRGPGHAGLAAGHACSDGVLDGDLVIKGTRRPEARARALWLMLRRVQQLGVREIRGDIVLDRSAFSMPEQNPAEFDGEPLRPYNVAADALLINYKSMVLTFTPDAARGAVAVSSDTPLAGVRIDTLPTLVTGPCDDWRAALKPDMADPQRLRFTGDYPAACGEKQWPIAYVEPKSYNARALVGLWHEMGGVLDGTVRDGVGPADAAELRAALATAGRRGARDQQVQATT